VLGGSGSFEIPAGGRLGLDAALLLVAGAGAVAVAGALRPRRSPVLLLPVALAIGVPAAGASAAGGDGLALVLMLLALTVAGAWAAVADQVRDARLLAAALALAALAAAAVPSSGIPGSGAAVRGVQAAGVPAAWLLAAAAVITAVCLVPLAALSALPGAASFVVVLIADPEPVRLVLAALAATLAVAAAVAVRRSWPPTGDRDDPAGGAGSASLDLLGGALPAAVPALALGAWLAVAPGTWTWAGEIYLDGWSDTVALAAAGGLIVAVAAGSAGRVALPRRPVLAAADPDLPSTGGGLGSALTLSAGVALALALVALALVA
jgi:hypothetical protein